MTSPASAESSTAQRSNLQRYRCFGRPSYRTDHSDAALARSLHRPPFHNGAGRHVPDAAEPAPDAL